MSRCRARKLRYPFRPRNWSNGIHLFNRANSIGATPAESLKRETRAERGVQNVQSRGKTVYSLVLPPSLLWHFRHLRRWLPSLRFSATQIATGRYVEDGAEFQGYLGLVWIFTCGEANRSMDLKNRVARGGGGGVKFHLT